MLFEFRRFKLARWCFLLDDWFRWRSRTSAPRLTGRLCGRRPLGWRLCLRAERVPAVLRRPDDRPMFAPARADIPRGSAAGEGVPLRLESSALPPFRRWYDRLVFAT